MVRPVRLFVALLAVLLFLVLPGCPGSSDGSDSGSSGFRTLELWYMPNPRPYMPNPKEVAQIIKQDLLKVGLDIEIRTYDWSTYLQKTQNAEHDMCLLGWTTDNGDPDNFLYALLDKENAEVGAANNISFYRSEKVHDLLKKAQVQAPPAERSALYRKALQIIHEDAPMIPIAYLPQVMAQRKGVEGFVQNPVGVVRLHPVELTEPIEGSVLLYGRGNDSDKLDPIRTTEGESVKVITQIYDTLVTYAPDSPALVPGLADSWEPSDNGKTWTFHLRKGVTFHDGSAFDADDVVYTFERILGDDSVAYGPNYAMIDSVEAVDAQTVRFHLKSPSAVFLPNLAMFPANIVPKGATDLERKPIGTGPFRFKTWEPMVKIHLEAFSDHWRGAPKLDGVIFSVIPENSVRLMQLRDGGIHFMDGLSFSDLKQVEKTDGIELLQGPGMNFGYLAFNLEKEPFKSNPTLRRAIAHAIDRDRIIQQAFSGYGEPGLHPLPPTIWQQHEGTEAYPFDAGVERREHDPDKARRLLKEAAQASTPVASE